MWRSPMRAANPILLFVCPQIKRMKVLLIEDNPTAIRNFKEAFRSSMPEAELSIAISFRGYLNVEEIHYDAYILDNIIADNRDAFQDIAPRIRRMFPDAVLLYNSSNTKPKDVHDAEALTGIRFARDGSGDVMVCGKDPEIAIKFIREMVADRKKLARKSIPPLTVRKSRSSIPPRA